MRLNHNKISCIKLVHLLYLNTGLYKINIISDEKRANLYSHLERNVMVQLRLKFRFASYFL